MARPIYSDLLLPFSLGSSTNPTSTQATNLIIELFKQAFIERNETYTTETDTILDTETAYAIIKSEASRLITQWINSLKMNTQISIPVLYLSKEAITKLKQLVKQTNYSKAPIIDNIRLWNSDAEWQ
jgi:hypothetical protein